MICDYNGSEICGILGLGHLDFTRLPHFQAKQLRPENPVK